MQQKLSEESAAKYELAVNMEKRETELRKYGFRGLRLLRKRNKTFERALNMLRIAGRKTAQFVTGSKPRQTKPSGLPK